MQVLVRYHEIGLKGKNRPFFVERLAGNLREATADLAGIAVRVWGGRLLLEVPDAAPWGVLRGRIEASFGVANFSRITVVAPELGALRAAALAAVQGLQPRTFRVTTTRAFKGFPKTSMEIDRELGGVLAAATGWAVDLGKPELQVFVEVHKDRFLLAAEKLPGPGGFPVGSSGKVVALLSGGIDSPVAAWRLMKRGCRVVPVHFHAFPLLDRTTIDKVKDLARLLTRWQLRTRLQLVPFGALQQAIVAACPAPLRVVLYRRFMVRIGEALAARHGAKALVTGESLGQVASQTLDNMAVIDEAARGPVLRPLVGMDKEEIVVQARAIGTFETSTLPDQDCCQLFVPKSPATAATLVQVREAERALDVDGMVRAALHATEEERYRFPEHSADTGRDNGTR